MSAQFFKGIIFGAAIACAGLIGYAYGTDTEFTDHTFGENERERCDVDVGFGRRTIGDQCRFNDVMVGSDGDYIYCASIYVNCRD